MSHDPSTNARPWRKLYNTAMWRKLRERQLMEQPLCSFCLQSDVVEAATVVDHITPHKGVIDLFASPSNLQSLCKAHHDGDKQRIEHGQAIVTFGADGWPTD